MKNQKTLLSLLLVLCMVLSLLPAPVFAQEEAQRETSADVAFTKLDDAQVDVKAEPQTEPLETSGYADTDLVTVIVVLEEKSLLDQGYTKAQIASGDRVLNQAKKEISAQQDAVLGAISHMTGTDAEAAHRYSVILSGFSTVVPFGMLDEIQAMDGVRSAFVAPVFQIPETRADSIQTNTYATTESFGSAKTWNAMGYTGAGMRIAILDTGLDTDHPSFADAPVLAESSLSQQELSSVLSGLNAASIYQQTTGQTLDLEDVYYSEKVPFGFNYALGSLDITHDNDQQGDHGTHVAGIAAANAIDSTDVVGVAPDAQLIIMKVFGGESGASFADIVAALEDCYRLNVDAVNMSLGADAAFTTIGDDIWDEVFSKIEDNDMIASVSAGNAGSAADYNAYGTDLNLTKDPDNGIVSSPATWRGTTMVASLENTTNRVSYFSVGNTDMAYTDTNSGTSRAFTSLEGTQTYVMVPGYGTEEDLAQVDVQGRIAVIRRGELDFATKQTNAHSAGAIGCVIYDNVEGDLINIQDAGLLPNVFVSKASGEVMAAQATDGVGQMHIHGDNKLLDTPNATGGQLSDFSSWGVTPDLQLEPDVTAPGGYIYSSVNNGAYGVMSGTSMSAPHIAGMAALVLQYLHEEHADLTDAEMHTAAEALIMSTATPVREESGLEYSPRKQGAGSANVYDAIVSDGYLTVDGSTPKVSLGDDDEKLGVYDFSFELHNFSDRALSYELDASLLTDQVNTDYEEAGYLFMGETSKALTGEATFTVLDGSLSALYDINADGTCDLQDVQALLDVVTGLATAPEGVELDVNGDHKVDTLDAQVIYEAITDGLTEHNVVVVKPGDTATVHVSVALSQEDKDYMDAYYPNGIYVEGFVRCYALDEDNADLSLPYMGFYGDWSQAPVLDTGWYYDEEPEYNRYLNCIWTNYGAYTNYFGMSGYLNEGYDPAHNVLSPNDDAYNDTINDMYLSLMRGVKLLRLTYTDDATGDILWQNEAQWVSKSYYVSSAGVNYPFVLSDYFNEDEIYDFTDANGNYLPNNTTVTLTVDAFLDDGDDVADETITLPITIDTQAPELLSARKLMDVESGQVTRLELTFRDNVAVSAVALLNGDGTKTYDMVSVTDPAADEDGSRTYTVTFDVEDMDEKIMVVLADYGMNEAAYGLNLGGQGKSFGSLVAFQYNYNTNINGWVSFEPDVQENETAIFASGLNFVCAEYVNGYVYAQTDTGALYGFTYESMLGDTNALEPIFITQLDNVYQDLAYSYAEGKLYGLYTSEYEGYPTTEVHSIHLGEPYYDSSIWDNVNTYDEIWVTNRGGLYGLSLAVDDAGTVYVLGPIYDWDTEDLSETAYLWSASLEYDGWLEKDALGTMTQVGDTGLSMNYLQSMTWDHNTETLYWARFNAERMDPESYLMIVDPKSAACEQVGVLSGETSGLFAPLSAESAAKESHSNVPQMDSSVLGTPSLSASSITMNVGGTDRLVCTFDPWYTEHKQVKWSSSNEDVASVDENGLVTALAEGSAVITVCNAEDESLQATCTVAVTALDLELEGLFTKQVAGTGATGGVQLYNYTMKDGEPTFTPGETISAPEELNFGLSISASTYGRGSIWACEYGNAGMIYQIDAETGVVQDALEPIDGDHLYGMTYSNSMDNFYAIMNMYLYVDLPFTEDVYEEIQDSYDPVLGEMMWHKLDMLPYLIESNNGFVTGEEGQGASSEIVFTGLTVLEEESYQEMYSDYTGSGWDSASYTAAQTLVLMDNVGRLWYVDEVPGLIAYADGYGNVTYVNADFDPTVFNITTMIPSTMNGVQAVEYTDAEGNTTYNVFVLRKIDETPMTDLFRAGTLPRMTYAFSDLTFAGKSEQGNNLFLVSLYDYWNNGTTNELYLLATGVETGETTWNPSTGSMEAVKTPDQLYALGNIGEHNIAATIHSATVTGGLSLPEPEEPEAAQALAAGIYTAQTR